MIKKTTLLLVPIILLGFKNLNSQTLLTLEKALEIAEANSPSIIQAKLNLDAQNAALDARLAGLKPRIGLNVTPFRYSRNISYADYLQDYITTTSMSTNARLSVSQSFKKTDSRISFNNNSSWDYNENVTEGTEKRAFNNRMDISFDQPLFTYNKTKMDLENLEFNIENAQIRYTLQQMSIEQNVTRMFYSLYTSFESLKIAEEELENRIKNFDIIKNKVDAGLVAEVEFIQAQIDLATSQASYYDRVVSLENSKDQLKQTIGLPLDEDIQVLADISTDSVGVDLQKAVDYALLNRMELRQREIDIINSYNNLIQQKETNSLDGTLSLSLGISGNSPDFVNIYENPSSTPTVDISFDVPIFDWGQRKALIKQAELNYQVSELNMKDERISIQMEIRSTYRSLANLYMQIKIKEKNRENADKTYAINEEKYNNGELTGMQLNDYQRQLSQSKIDYNSAMINYKMELLSLKIQTLWDFENDKPVIEKTNSIQ